MNMNQPIYTEDNNCQDCYKCVRHCPVKAIKISGNCASVIDELCIACGKCVEVCPVGAKKVRSDLEVVKLLLRTGKKVVLSVAPSWVSCFPNWNTSGFIYTLQQMGFTAVSETALGAELVNRYIRQELQTVQSGIRISSACPTVVEYIRRHRPELTQLIMPVVSPMLAHARYLKQYYGPDTHVVFAGPCISKKRESDAFRQLVAASLTFKELEIWVQEQWVNPETNTGEEYHFEPVEAVSGSLYPVDGGMIAGLNTTETQATQFMSFSGVDAVENLLKTLHNWQPKKNVFIELLSCAGGCINGPAIPCKDSSLGQRYSNVLDATSTKAKQIGPHKELVFPVELQLQYLPHNLPLLRHVYTAEDIMESLRAVGKQTTKEELNCGGCGYDSCQEFAIAMLEGKAERNMCVSYMRRVAQNKASVLLQRIPSGVMIVDDNLKVIECNRNMANMLGEEVKLIFEAKPGLPGADVRKLMPFHKLFRTVLDTGKDIIDREIRLNGSFLKVSIFTIQAHKIVCSVVRDLYNPEVRNDEIVKRTRSIITENLETVQKIAYLLGENASRTETSLNSILEILKDNQDDPESLSY
ncbi:MAG: [Fe-Fe] hydrogenase large subunit C-terminal domain-containing protein [Bacteroidales bacterium]